MWEMHELNILLWNIQFEIALLPERISWENIFQKIISIFMRLIGFNLNFFLDWCYVSHMITSDLFFNEIKMKILFISLKKIESSKL